MQEGNAFSHVCLSVILSGGCPHVTITHDALDLTIQGNPRPWPPIDMGSHYTGTPPPLPRKWDLKLVQLDLTVQGPRPPSTTPGQVQTCSLFTMASL